MKALELLLDLKKRVEVLEATNRRLLAALGGSSSSDPGVGVGPVDLDSEQGDPQVYRDPPRWQGQTFQGKFYSETTPEYLDAMASFKDWVAMKEDEKGSAKNAGYARLDAARARGWGVRLRTGWKAPERPAKRNPFSKPAEPAPAQTSADDQTSFADSYNDDEIPFVVCFERRLRHERRRDRWVRW